MVAARVALAQREKEHAQPSEVATDLSELGTFGNPKFTSWCQGRC